jgi:hypothetical protein
VVTIPSEPFVILYKENKQPEDRLPVVGVNLIDVIAAVLDQSPAVIA